MAHPTPTSPLSAGVTTSLPHPSGSGARQGPHSILNPGLFSPGSGEGRPPTPTTTLKAETAHEGKASLAADALPSAPSPGTPNPAAPRIKNLRASPAPQRWVRTSPPGLSPPLPLAPRSVPSLLHGSHHSAVSGCSLGARLPAASWGLSPAPPPPPPTLPGRLAGWRRSVV